MLIMPQFIPNTFGDLIIVPEQAGGGTKYYIRFTLGTASRVYSIEVMKQICLDVLNKISRIEKYNADNPDDTPEKKLMKRHNIA